MTTAYQRLAPIMIFAFIGGGCSADTTPTDLRTLERASSPNDALACPPAICSAKAEMESPPLAIEAEQLREIVHNVITAQARTEFAGEDSDIGQLIFVQRSRLFGFPDTIWIQTVDLESNISLIIYSRSNVGFWDLGVNRRRVHSWLAEIESAARAAGGDSAETQTSAGAKSMPR